MKTFSRAAVLSLAVAGALGSLDCASKSEYDSESHFLCQSDSDCENYADRQRCVVRRCVALAHPDAGSSTGGASANDSGGRVRTVDSGGAAADAGTEQPGPRPGGSGPGTASGPPGIDAGPTCTKPPSSACSACLESTCGSEYSSCLAQATCRQSLDQYAACLGSTCTSATTETCAASHLTPNIENCLAACQTECAGTALATSCDLYCGCIPICDTAEYHNANPGTPVLTGLACLAACTQNSITPGLVECMRDHCEYGSNSPGTFRLTHCEHATGVTPVCTAALPN